MAKLTNAMRLSFVRAAMADVPDVDYQQDIIKLVLADAVKQLPPKVRELYLDKKLVGYINTANAWVAKTYVHIPAMDAGFVISASVLKQATELREKSNEQFTKRSSLEQKLSSVANGCTTTAQLLAALPEFEKYLPASDGAACLTLPAIANVVSDFVKAGWPKGKKAAA